MGTSLKCPLWYCQEVGKCLLLSKTLENELFALKVWQKFDHKNKWEKAVFEPATWQLTDSRFSLLSYHTSLLNCALSHE